MKLYPTQNANNDIAVKKDWCKSTLINTCQGDGYCYTDVNDLNKLIAK